MKFGQLIECKGSFKKYVGRGGMKGSLKSERKRTVRGGVTPIWTFTLKKLPDFSNSKQRFFYEHVDIFIVIIYIERDYIIYIYIFDRRG